MSMTDEKPFQGFKHPRQNWSKLPHQLITALPLFSSRAELAVVLYILRHTWGYKDRSKRITLDEFENGRKRRNGARIDKGIGMSKPSIITGLRDAEAHGFIVVEVDSSDTARVKKFYSLAIFEMSKSLTPDVKEFDTGGKEVLHRTEKETSDRNSKKKIIAPSGASPSKPSDSEDNYIPFDGGANPDLPPDDDDAAHMLYPCTAQDVAALIDAWWWWTPRRPEKRGQLVTLKSHMANKTNREFAETLWGRGVRPADIIRCLIPLRERDDTKAKEINFVYAGEVCLTWTEADRAENIYTWDAPRITNRRPGGRIDPGKLEEFNLEALYQHPDLIVDVPPPFIVLAPAPPDDGDDAPAEDFSIDDIIKQPGWEL